ncbi:adenosylcobinamide-GDP ribazoletransferase [Sphingomonas sp. PB2P12]|uniref:adenosylcobinamide-GDP ribazoletransferase n=1 Tax=Sphingomonas sandaracina TaxID=3096157 RepID=UPI002FCB6508
MRRLILAFGFLTRLPMPHVAAEPGDFAAAVRLYPLVGLAIGALVAGAGWIGSLIDPWVGACAALLTWTAVTGALHLDGLADLTDGLGAAHGDRTRLLAVMSDPHIGSFGVVAIVGQMLSKLVALHAIGATTWWPLIFIAAAARLGPLVWAPLLPPLRPEGLAAAVSDAVRPRDLIGWGLLLLLACVPAPVLLATPFLILGYAAWLRHKIGGITGDAHGAGIELVETGLLLAFCASAALLR